MKLCALVPLVLFQLGCAPMLALGPTGWQLERAPYRILEREKGLIAPVGFRISNYSRVSETELRKSELNDDLDIAFSRPEDDGVAMLRTVATESSKKTLSTLADRVLDPSLADFGGVVFPLGQVKLIGRADFHVTGGDGHEVLFDRHQLGAPAGHRIYVALLRAPGTRDVVQLSYINRAHVFDAGLLPMRDFARRIAFGSGPAAKGEPLPPLQPGDGPKGPGVESVQRTDPRRGGPREAGVSGLLEGLLLSSSD